MRVFNKSFDGVGNAYKKPIAGYDRWANESSARQREYMIKMVALAALAVLSAAFAAFCLVSTFGYGVIPFIAFPYCSASVTAILTTVFSESVSIVISAVCPVGLFNLKFMHLRYHRKNEAAEMCNMIKSLKTDVKAGKNLRNHFYSKISINGWVNPRIPIIDAKIEILKKYGFISEENASALNNIISEDSKLTKDISWISKETEIAMSKAAEQNEKIQKNRERWAELLDKIIADLPNFDCHKT